MSHQIGAAIMASAAGAVRDYLGEYDVAFLAGGIIAMIAAGLGIADQNPSPVKLRRRRWARQPAQA